MDGDPAAAQQPDPIIEEYDTYEDYLDSQVTPADMYHLEDAELARQLVELGIRGNGDAIKREEFEARKAAAEAARLARLDRRPKRLLSAGRDLSGCPLLQALAAREEAVRNGKLATIAFVRAINPSGQEVSAYIDYGARLAGDPVGMEAVFARRRRLLPRPTDLSYYNWATGRAAASAPSAASSAAAASSSAAAAASAAAASASVLPSGVAAVAPSSSSSATFAVLADGGPAGLQFKCKRDRKVVAADPRRPPGEATARSNVEPPGEGYLQAVLYDHVLRRR